MEGQVSLSTLLVTFIVYMNSSFFGYFDGHHKIMFIKLWENLHYRFFSFPGNQIPRHISLSVSNCKLIKDMLHTFCLGQSLYDICILIQ